MPATLLLAWVLGECGGAAATPATTKPAADVPEVCYDAVKPWKNHDGSQHSCATLTWLRPVRASCFALHCRCHIENPKDSQHSTGHSLSDSIPLPTCFSSMQVLYGRPRPCRASCCCSCRFHVSGLGSVRETVRAQGIVLQGPNHGQSPLLPDYMRYVLYACTPCAPSRLQC